MHSKRCIGIVDTSSGTKKEINCLLDGQDHINLGMLGVSNAGRTLCPHAYKPFTHPVLGDFASMSGFIMYLRSGCKAEFTRTRSGHEMNGVNVPIIPIPPAHVNDYIRTAIITQVEKYPAMSQALKETRSLPLVNYHIFGLNAKNRVEHRRYLILLGEYRAKLL